MKKIISVGLVAVLLLSAISVSVVVAHPQNRLWRLTWDTNPEKYVHGLAVDVGDGMDWYFSGPGSDGVAIDIPGHVWKQTGHNSLLGLHYNVGPIAAAGLPWWASGEDYGVLLYVVEARIAPWTYEIANKMAGQGYIHYHELVDSVGNLHPTLVVWLKHTAVRSFDLDGGPAPALGHPVTKGVDNLFIPIYFNPYSP